MFKKLLPLKRQEPFFKALVAKRNRSLYVQVTIIIVKSQSAWGVQSHNWHVKVLDFAPFRGSYVREFGIYDLLYSTLKQVKHNS